MASIICNAERNPYLVIYFRECKKDVKKKKLLGF
jgi:hypothetical protein